jgi:hypothetical protein
VFESESLRARKWKRVAGDDDREEILRLHRCFSRDRDGSGRCSGLVKFDTRFKQREEKIIVEGTREDLRDVVGLERSYTIR